MPRPESRDEPQVLLCWHAPFHDWWVSGRQITIGPFVEDADFVGGRRKCRKVPAGAIDLGAFVRALPPEDRPDLVVVVLDMTRALVPLNLAAIDCPKILLLGDTHHGDTPIGFALGYALKEGFDKVIGNHVPQHLHFFREAGLSVGWVPGAWVRDERFEPGPARPDRFVHVGQVGDRHPVRLSVLSGLAERDLPVDLYQTRTAAEAAGLYAGHLGSLNISLNGDLNQRVFEVLTAGGCLITDRLAPEAGLEMLFREGEHLFTAEVARFAPMLRRLLDDPTEAARAARAGHDHYRRLHSEAVRARRLLAEGLGGWREMTPLLPPDARLDEGRLHGSGRNAGALVPRIRAYEAAQEHHRRVVAPSFHPGQDVGADVMSDLVDLHRARILAPDAPVADATAALVGSPADVERLAAAENDFTGDVVAVGGPETENALRAKGIDPTRLSRHLKLS
ncbi:MAG: glycosyltransferase [Alphaproteobacteria bacterium]|nr:glycosyltransferase [Alphaproteobacteria bacterium]